MGGLKFLAGVIFILNSLNGFSQSTWSPEFRSGLNFPTEQITGVEVSTGFGFEFKLAYDLFRPLAIYAGWGWNEFRVDEELGETYLDLEEGTFTLGLQFLQPLGNSGIVYLLRGGAVYGHFEFEDIEGNVYADSGYGFGWQVETGFGFNISSTWSLRPGIRYRTTVKEIEIDNNISQVDLNYFSIGISLTKQF